MAAVKGLGKPGVPTALRAVTPTDATDLPGGSARISVTTAGVYRLVAHSDSAAVDVQLAAGVVHPTLIRQVYASGSASAVGVVAHYE